MNQSKESEGADETFGNSDTYTYLCFWNEHEGYTESAWESRVFLRFVLCCVLSPIWVIIPRYPGSVIANTGAGAWLLAGWVTEDVFWVLVIVCCSQSSPVLPSSPSTTHFLTHIGCQVGEAGERGSSEISHQADNINNSRLSQPASDTLHTSAHSEFRTNFHSNKNHFKFKIRLKFSKLKR